MYYFIGLFFLSNFSLFIITCLHCLSDIGTPPKPSLKTPDLVNLTSTFLYNHNLSLTESRPKYYTNTYST